MPHHINWLEVHADNHANQNEGITNLLSQLDLIADIENRQQNNGQQTAVNFWATLYINRVILCWQQLRNQVNQFKLCGEQFFQLLKLVAIAVEDVAQLCPDALSKFHFTLAQGVNHWQQHNRRTEQTCNGRIAHSADGLEIVICLSALAVCTEEQIENKVNHNKDGNHEANIEMSYKHKCQRNGVVDFSAIIDQTFQSGDNQRQEYQTIQPHRVDQLNHSICHHCIHAGEQQSMRSTDFSPLLEIVAECHARCTKFAELHNQQAGKNPFFRQQHDNQRKWAGKIIANDTHKVAGEVSRPVIEDAAISPKSVPQGLKVVHILPVQVQTEYRFFAEWGNPKQSIRQIGQCNRNEKCNDIKLVANEPSLQAMSNTGERQRTAFCSRRRFACGCVRHEDPPKKFFLSQTSSPLKESHL